MKAIHWDEVPVALAARWCAGERQVARLIDALTAGLETCGPARMRSGEGLFASARDDNVPACVVEFGAPAVAALRTSDGHPIVWIWLGGATPDVDELLRTVAAGTRLQRTSLQWDKLVEPGVSFSPYRMISATTPVS